MNFILQHFAMVLTIFVHSTLMKSGIFMMALKSIMLEILDFTHPTHILMNHMDIHSAIKFIVLKN